MPTVRALFFDIGDTLVFDDPPLPMRLALASQAFGVTVDAAAYKVGEAYVLSEYLRGIPWNAPASMREAVARMWQASGQPPLGDADWQMLARTFAQIPVTRYVPPEGFKLLAELKARGFVLGAISDWEDTLPALLVELGISPYFDALAVSGIVGVTKPAPALFQDALRQASVAPENSLHVGDWYALDIAGAQAAGMSALLFDHANRTPDADCPRVTTFDAMAEYLLALPHEGDAIR